MSVPPLAGRIGLALALFLAALTPAPAAPLKVQLPADLDLVPRDAVAFFHVRAADLWKDDAFADVRRVFDHAGPEAFKRLNSKHFPALSTVERVSLVMLTPESLADPLPPTSPVSVSALLVVATAERFDPKQLRATTGWRAKKHAGREYDLDERTWNALLVVDDHTFVIGSEDAVLLLLERWPDASKEGPLTMALREAAQGGHILTAAVNPKPFDDAGFSRQLPEAVHPLFKASCATVTVDLGKQFRLDARLHFDNGEDAKAGEKAARALLEMGRAVLQQQIGELEERLKQQTKGAPTGWQNLPENVGLVAGLGMLRFADAQLQNALLERDGPAVGARFTSGPVQSTSLALFGITSITAITALGQNAQNTFRFVGNQIKGDSPERWKPMAEAMDKYYKEKGHYPPAAICSKTGEPLLSWRVALLPYMGEEELYRQFKLDEPWDSRNNKKLLMRMPGTLRSMQGPDGWTTTVQGFTGPGTMFEGRTGVRRGEVTDGLANTILLVEAGFNFSVPWTKPADIPFGKGEPGSGAWDWRKGGFTALFADGSPRSIAPDTPEQRIRAWITRNGGEIAKPPE